MKHIFVFLLLCLFIFCSWVTIQETYYPTNIFLSTIEIGAGSACDFSLYYELSKKFYASVNIYDNEIDQKGSATYPPTMYFYFAPISNLQFNTAFIVWTIMKIASIILTAYIVSLLMVPEWKGNKRFLLVCLGSIILYVFAPAQDDLVIGQINLLVLCFLALAILLAQRKQFELCGMVLGLIFSFKLFSVLILLYFLFKLNWRVLWGSAISIIIFNAPIVYYYGTEIYLNYFKHLSWAKVCWINDRNFSIYAQSFLIMHKMGIQPFDKAEKIAQIIHYSIAFIVVVITLVVLLKNNKNNTGENYFRDFSLLILATYTITPYHWNLHHLWIIIPFMYLISVMVNKNKINYWGLTGLTTLYVFVSLFGGNIINGKYQYLAKIYTDAKTPILILLILWELLLIQCVAENKKAKTNEK